MRAALALAAAVMVSAALSIAHGNQDRDTDNLRDALSFLANQTSVTTLIGQHRLLVVGAPGADSDDMDALWKEQLRALSPFSDGALDRKLMLINDSTRVSNPEVDAIVGAISLRREIGSDEITPIMIDLRPRADMRPTIGGGWQVALVGLDGSVKKRWNRIVTEEEVFALIDSMPMRQDELDALNAADLQD